MPDHIVAVDVGTGSARDTARVFACPTNPSPHAPTESTMNACYAATSCTTENIVFEGAEAAVARESGRARCVPVGTARS